MELVHHMDIEKGKKNPQEFIDYLENLQEIFSRKQDAVKDLTDTFRLYVNDSSSSISKS